MPILLLAEDNLPDTLLVREAIRMAELRIELHIVPDGEAALTFLANAESGDRARPDMLLLDLNLPKIEGFEILRRVRESETWHSIPVIVVSSSDSDRDKKEAADLGAAYFRKPTRYDEFLKIGGVLKKLLQENHLI